jgi:lipid-binding SYLF domain-containing protein
MSRIAALLLCVCVLLPTAVWAGPEEEEKLAQAVAVLDKLMLVPEQSIPEALLRDAHAVAVVPNVFKAALVFGGRRGTGVISVRRADGTWSHPSFMALTGGSFGFQAGLQSSDVILVFRTQRGVDNIIRGKFTLGADASVAAGPVGRNAQASTDEQLKAEIYAWSRARGLFAGISLDGAVLNIDNDANAAVYGPETTPRAIFEGRVERGSEQVVDFRDRLEEYSSR